MVLRRVAATDEAFEVVLICDPSVWASQIKAARRMMEKEIPKMRDGDLVSMFVDSLRISFGEEADLSVALSEVKTAASAVLGTFMDSEERDRAEKRLREEMDDADLRECLAWVRAQNAAAKYRNTSDASVLIDPKPEGATIVRLRSVRSDELRRIERAVGPKPRLGSIHYAKAADQGRRAMRRGKDSAQAFAEYLQGLPASTLAAVEDFEDWQENVDRLVCARAVISVSGFELEREGDEFPVLSLLEQIPEQGRDVVSEIAAHCRQVGSLGKSEPSESRSLHGTEEPDGDPADPVKGGHAGNASEQTEDRQSMA